MKPAPFDLAIPSSLDHAAALLAIDGARAMAGGQSLGPMLNLRATRPTSVVPLGALAGLHGAADAPEHVTIGAATTHAMIADGRTPDLPGGVLARVAQGIAYRAVRNRGTIGGSLCHADPAADWLTTLTALGATIITTTRAIPLPGFVVGPYTTVLQPGEIVRAVRVPKPAPAARWCYIKLCRKPGEFAHAMAACLNGPMVRLAIGAVGGPPILLTGETATLAEAGAALQFMEPAPRRIQLEAVARALAGAVA